MKKSTLMQKFHTLTLGESTVYFTDLRFETKSEISRISLLNQSTYKRRTDSDCGKIIIRGNFEKGDLLNVNSVIETLNQKKQSFEIDGISYSGRVIEYAFCKTDSENLLGDFEIRLVKCDE